tara:strand:- start:284 stop:517 length:234 start_codon:yes stop_codon:yes gene_type:complete
MSHDKGEIKVGSLVRIGYAYMSYGDGCGEAHADFGKLGIVIKRRRHVDGAWSYDVQYESRRFHCYEGDLQLVSEGGE